MSVDQSSTAANIDFLLLGADTMFSVKYFFISSTYLYYIICEINRVFDICYECYKEKQ